MLHTSISTSGITAVIVFFQFFPSAALSQDQPDSSFPTAAISAKVARLDKAWDTQNLHAQELQREQLELQKRFQDSEVDMRQIGSQSILTELQAAQAEMSILNTQNPVTELKKSEQLAANLMQGQRDFQALMLQSAFVNAFKQLSAAQQLLVERRVKLLKQAEILQAEVNLWQQANQELINQYVELADLEAIRSAAEWEAALAELEKADPENVLAQWMKAGMLIRLNRTADAEKVVDSLVRSNGWIVPLARGMQLEIESRRNDKAATNRMLRITSKLAADWPALQLQRTFALARLEQWDAAETELKHLQDEKKFAIAVSRTMAAVKCISGKTHRDRKFGLSHATVAVGLSGDQDWKSQLVMALAQAANGDFGKAEAAAKSAEELAPDNHKAVCSTALKQIQAGAVPTWNF